MPTITFHANLEELSSDVWRYAVFVPFDIASQFIVGNDKRVICSILGIDPFKCGLLGNGNGDYMVVPNKKRKVFSISLSL